MSWLVVFGAALMGSGVLLMLLHGRTRARRRAWITMSAESLGRIGPVLERIAGVDDAAARLGRALDTAVPDAGPTEAGAAYAAAAERLVRISREHLDREPSAAVLRFGALADGLAADDGPDPYAAELEAVAATMRTRRLGHADVTPLGVQPYETVARWYTHERRRGMLATGADMTRRLDALGQALRWDHRQLPSTSGLAREPLAEIAALLRDSIDEHLDTLRPLLGRRGDGGIRLARRDRAALARQIGEVEGDLATADGITGRGAPLEALRGLAAVSVPSVAGRSDDAFATACETVVGRLEVLADEQDAALVDRVAASTAALDRRVTELLDAVAAGVEDRDRRRRVAFRSVLAAADSVAADVRMAIIDGRQSSPLDAVAAAAAAVAVGDRAATHLALRTTGIVPTQPPTADDPRGRAHGYAALLVELDRNAAALAVLSAVLDALGGSRGDGGRVGLPHGVAGLAALPPELARAVGDLTVALHGPALPPRVAEVTGKVRDLGPVADSGTASDGVVGMATDVRRVLATASTDPASPLGASVRRLTDLTAQSAHATDALQQLSTAGGPAPGSLPTDHLDATCLPLATLAVTIAREVVEHPEKPVATLVATLSESIDARLETGRDRRSRLSEPPRPPDAGKAIAGLDARVRAYCEQVATLLDGVSRTPTAAPARKAATAAREAVATDTATAIDTDTATDTDTAAEQRAAAAAQRVAAARAAVERARAALVDVPDLRAALPTLAGIALPFHLGWGPADELAAHCAAAATELRTEADEHYARLAAWVRQAADVVGATRHAVELQVVQDVAVFDEHRTVIPTG